MRNATPIEFFIAGGYWPSTGDFPPDQFLNTIKAGLNVWLRAGNKIEVANGSTQLSTTNVGARIFSLNDDRAEIAGALVSERLPFAGLIRYLGGTFLFLSELTSQQVYINETSVTGVTTASSAGILRVSIPDGAGGYNTFDAGFEKPGAITAVAAAGGTKAMAGQTGVALCAWRTSTNAVSAPSEIVYNNLTADDVIRIPMPAAVSGQDGWIYAGTAPGDTSGTLRVVRYIRIFPRGTFTATNGSANITAGIGTFFNQDLRVGDVVTIDAASYTIATVTSQTTATLTTNFTGTTGAGKTMFITTAQAEWRASTGSQGELGALIDFNTFKPPKAAGVLQFMNLTFLFGTDAESASAVTGPGIRLMLNTNPEHVGLFALTTVYGDDILNVLPANDQRSKTCYILTPNTLELLEFTDNVDDPYRIRVIHQPGFMGAKAGIVYQNVFYGFSRAPFRTVTDGDVDTTFGAAVMRTTRFWDDPVIMGVDPLNEAVLFSQWDSVNSVTNVLAFHPQLQAWSPPIQVSGRIVDFATVNGVTYFTLLTGGNYRVYTWEGGVGASGAFVGTQYRSDPDGGLSNLESFVFTGRGTSIKYYIASPDMIPPDVGTSSSATFTKSIMDTWQTHAEQYPNLKPGRGLAVRIDFSTSGNIERMIARLIPKRGRR